MVLSVDLKGEHGISVINDDPTRTREILVSSLIIGEPAAWYSLRGNSILYAFAKRIIDIVGSILLLVITSPVLLISAVLIKLTSPGPVIFKQKRAGLMGRPFVMYKLRTMVDGMEDTTSIANGYPSGVNGAVFKLKDDPRITPVGKVLRKLSIDELPQLVNVLKGQMSLVGPRPLPLDQIRFDTIQERARLTVKPGLTGLWQVSGRSDIPYDEWIELDYYYVVNRSLWLDLIIILKTIPAVLSCRGAY